LSALLTDSTVVSTGRLSLPYVVLCAALATASVSAVASRITSIDGG
jgi:hypothetical protein